MLGHCSISIYQVKGGSTCLTKKHFVLFVIAITFFSFNYAGNFVIEVLLILSTFQ